MKRPADTWLSVGRRLLVANEYDLALKAFERSILIEGVTAEAMTGAGIAAEKRGLMKMAARYFDRARSLAPNSEMANNNLGVVLFRLRDYYPARQAFQAAFALSDGRNDLALRNLRMAERKIAELEEGRNYIDPATNMAVVRLGSSEFRLVDYTPPATEDVRIQSEAALTDSLEPVITAEGFPVRADGDTTLTVRAVDEVLPGVGPMTTEMLDTGPETADAFLAAVPAEGGGLAVAEAATGREARAAAARASAPEARRATTGETTGPAPARESAAGRSAAPGASDGGAEPAVAASEAEQAAATAGTAEQAVAPASAATAAAAGGDPARPVPAPGETEAATATAGPAGPAAAPTAGEPEAAAAPAPSGTTAGTGATADPGEVTSRPANPPDPEPAAAAVGAPAATPAETTER